MKDEAPCNACMLELQQGNHEIEILRRHARAAQMDVPNKYFTTSTQLNFNKLIVTIRSKHRRFPHCLLLIITTFLSITEKYSTIVLKTLCVFFPVQSLGNTSVYSIERITFALQAIAAANLDSTHHVH